MWKEKGADSPMSLIWMVEHGVFPHAEAERMQKEYTRAKAGGKGGGAMASPPGKKA